MNHKQTIIIFSTGFRRVLSGLMILALAVLGSLLLQGSPSQAAVPQIINYHGRLKNSSGAVLSGDYDFTFRLYDDIDTGNMVWGPESHLSTHVTNGYFNAHLGKNRSFAADGLDFTKPYYLTIEVNGDGEMAPRVSLTSFGYAFSAERLYAEDKNIDITTVNSGNVNINSAEAINLNADSSSTGLSVMQNGTGNLVEFKKPSGTVFIISNDGRVGVGTVSPSSELEVNGTTTTSNLTIGSLDGVLKATSGVVSAEATLGISEGGTNNSTYTADQFLVYDGLSIVSSGFDETSFASSAHSHNFTDLGDVPTDYSGQGGKLVAVNTGESGLEFIDVPSGLPVGTFGQTLYHDGSDWVADSFLFNNGSAIGIGTTSPSETLDVSGNIHTSGSLITGSTTTLSDGSLTRSSSGDGNLVISTTGGSEGNLSLDSSRSLYLTADYTNGGYNVVGDSQSLSASGGTLIVDPMSNDPNLHSMGMGLVGLFNFTSAESAGVNNAGAMLYSSNENPLLVGSPTRHAQVQASEKNGSDVRLQLESMLRSGGGTGNALISLHVSNDENNGNASVTIDSHKNPGITGKSSISLSAIGNGLAGDQSWISFQDDNALLYLSQIDSSLGNDLLNQPGEIFSSTGTIGSTIGGGETSNSIVHALNAVGTFVANLSTNLENAFIQNGNSFGQTAVLGTNDNYGLVFETNNSQRMIIDANGNVGVGTTAPTQKFHIYGEKNLDGVGLLVENNFSLDGTTAILLKAGNSTAGLSYGGSSNLLLMTPPGSNRGVAFGVNGLEKMRVDANGNIGIGTYTPSSFKVQVAGDVGPNTDNTYSLGSASLRWKDIYLGPGSLKLGSSGNQAVISYDETNHLLNYAVGSNPNVMVMGENGIGIGTTAPSAALDIVGDINVTGGYYLNGVPLGFIESGTLAGETTYWDGSAWRATDKMVFDEPNARLGINTKLPDRTLDVNGEVALRWENGDMKRASMLINGDNESVSFGGSVGIGTSTPSSALHLVGAEIIDNPNSGWDLDINNTLEDGVRISQSSTGMGMYIRQNGGTGLVLDNNTVNNGFWLSNRSSGVGMRVDNSGDGNGISIYDTNGKAALYTIITAGGSTGFYMENSGSGASINIIHSGDANAVQVENRGKGYSLFIGDELGDATPFVVDANGNVGIGTASPAANLDVVGEGYDSSGIRVQHSGDFVTGVLSLRKSGGTSASPTSVQKDYILGELEFGGYRTTNWSSEAAGLRSYATENWTDSTTGGDLRFYTTPNGDYRWKERQRIDEAGRVSIGQIDDNSRATEMMNILGGMDRGSATLNLDVADGNAYGQSAYIVINSDYANGGDPPLIWLKDNGTTQGIIEGYNQGIRLAGSQHLTLEKNGTTGAQELRFEDDFGGNYIGFKAPSSIGSNTIWTLPSADGTTGQVLSTDGSGTLSWADSGTSGNNSGWTDDGSVVRLTTSSDNVGIGTNSPTKKLHLYGQNDFAASGMLIENDFYTAGNADLWLKAGSQTAQIYYGGASSVLGLSTPAGSGSYINFETEGVTRMRINANGDIQVGPEMGIDGTTSHIGIGMAPDANAPIVALGHSRYLSYLASDYLDEGHMELFMGALSPTADPTNNLVAFDFNYHGDTDASNFLSMHLYGEGAGEALSIHTGGRIGVGTGENEVDPSAKLQIDSVTSGLLVPRMTESERNNISSPANGLLVYNTDADSFNYYNDTDWVTIAGAGASSGWIDDGSFVHLETDTDKVGIGTSLPTSKLHVETNVSIGQNVVKLVNGSGGGGGTVLRVETRSGNWEPAVYIENEGVAPGLYVHNFGSGNVNGFIVDGGRSGLGTSSPAALLDVGGGTPDYIDGINDALIAGDLEVDGTIYGNLAGSFNPGFSEGSVVFAGPAGLSENNTNFYWDNTNNRLGLGTNNPQTRLSIVGEGSQENGAASIAYFDSNPYSGGVLSLSHAAGTQSSPESITNDSGLGIITMQGYDGTAFGTGAMIIGIAGENWSGTAHGTRMTFMTTPLGTTSPQEAMRITEDGSIGIGSAGPREKLEVAGAIIIGNNSNTNAGTIRFTGTDFEGYTGSEWMSFTSDGGTGLPAGTNGQTLRHDGSNWVANSNLFNDGTNVGLGTTSPEEILDVNGENYGAIKISGAYLQSGGSSSMHLMSGGKYSDQTGDGAVIIAKNGDANGIEGQNSSLRLWTASGLTPGDSYNINEYTRVIVDSVGNVGIGTTTPEQILHINNVSGPSVVQAGLGSYLGGSTLFDNFAEVSGGSYYTGSGWTTNSTSSSSAIMSMFGGGTYFYGDTGLTPDSSFVPTLRMKIADGGNVGIGTNTPEQKLDVQSGHIQIDAGYGFQWDGACTKMDSDGNFVRVLAGCQERLRIDSTGNVGIGNYGSITPAEKLDVSGNVLVRNQGIIKLADADSSNFVGLKAPVSISSDVTWTLPNADGQQGQLLTTDGNGKLSWTNGGSYAPTTSTMDDNMKSVVNTLLIYASNESHYPSCSAGASGWYLTEDELYAELSGYSPPATPWDGNGGATASTYYFCDNDGSNPQNFNLVWRFSDIPAPIVSAERSIDVALESYESSNGYFPADNSSRGVDIYDGLSEISSLVSYNFDDQFNQRRPHMNYRYVYYADDTQNSYWQGWVANTYYSSKISATQDLVSENQDAASRVTLDMAYDANDNGLGRTIWADKGAVQIIGPDSSTTTFVVDQGRVGLGTTSPSQALDVSGSIKSSALNSNGTVYSNNGVLTNVNPSSQEYKDNIQALDLNPERLLGLEVKSFQWKDTGQSDFGLIAEDVRNILPELYVDDGTTKGYRLDHLPFYLLELAQKQNSDINSIFGSIGNLKTDPNALEKIQEYLNNFTKEIGSLKTADSENKAGLEAMNLKIADLQKAIENRLLEGDITFGGKVMFKGKVAFNSDTAGKAKVEMGQTEIEIKFKEPFEKDILPLINLTAQDFIAGQYKPAEISEDGFKIVLSQPQVKDIEFSWTAFSSDQIGNDQTNKISSSQ